MAKFSKIQVLQSMQQTGMIPVFYDENTQTAQSVLKACYEGGVRAFEFTNRGDFAIEVFKELIKYARQECPYMRLGAGTIIDAPTAALYIQAQLRKFSFQSPVKQILSRIIYPSAPLLSSSGRLRAGEWL